MSQTEDDYKAMTGRLAEGLGFKATMSDEEWQKAFEEFMQKMNFAKGKDKT